VEPEKPAIGEISKKRKPRFSDGHVLPFKKEHRTNPREIITGAHAMRRAYFCNGINRSTRQGLVITQLERKLAKHRGYAVLQDMPITQQLKVQLLLGNLIFLSLYEPLPDSKTGLRDYHTSQNLVDRILSELGMEPAETPEMSLQEYAEKLALEEEANASKTVDEEQEQAANNPSNAGESEQEQ